MHSTFKNKKKEIFLNTSLFFGLFLIWKHQVDSSKTICFSVNEQTYQSTHIKMADSFLVNSAPWWQSVEVKRPTLLLFILKMAEGELNVDSLISRLLEGEPLLPGLSLLTKVAFWAHF